MKKILLLIFLVGSVFHASAQSGSLQSESTAISDVSQRLANLQRDYDYLTCDYELFKLITDLKDLSTSLDNASNGVLVNVYNSRYDYRLYNVYSDNYKSSCRLFESLKEKTKSVKSLVSLKMAMSFFTEEETSVLNNAFSLVDAATTRVEKALEYYEVVIKAYQSKR